MEFIEILRKMNDNAREIVLLHALEDTIAYLEQEELGEFPDLLRAFNECLRKEQEKERSVDDGLNVNWEIVADLLSCASEKLERLYANKPRQTETVLSELTVVRHHSEYLRTLHLLEMISFWMQGLADTRFRFSDALRAFSRYAQRKAEAEKSTEEINHTWILAAGILDTAAKQAENPGQELP